MSERMAREYARQDRTSGIPISRFRGTLTTDGCSNRAFWMSPKERPKIHECYWAHFAAEIHFSE
jgi:hypothetical protein